MESWFKIFLVCILGFCVLMGGFCIIWPLTHQGEISTGIPDDPVIQQPDSKPADTEPEPEPEPEPKPAEVPAYEPPQPAKPSELTAEERRAQAMLRTMELEEKVYQLFIVTPEALTGVDAATIAGDATREALEAKPVGGLIYFSKNLVNREQTQAMLETTQSYAKKPLLLAVDEEGGTVARAGSNPDMGVTSFGNMADYGDAGDTQAVREVGETIGQELLELGFNLDFAPVADVLTNPSNVIGRRAFSSDPKTAADMVKAMVEGMEAAGCPSTLKHFPGHGDTTGDTHDGPTATRRSLDDMRSCEFLPFQAGIDAGAPLVMVGNFAAPLLTGNDDPVCFSRVVTTDLLRGELGFTGVIVTDALNMAAVSGSRFNSAEAAVKALDAGADLLLMPENLDEAVQGVLKAIEDGTLTESRIDDSVARVLTLKYTYKK